MLGGNVAAAVPGGNRDPEIGSRSPTSGPRPDRAHSGAFSGGGRRSVETSSRRGTALPSQGAWFADAIGARIHNAVDVDVTSTALGGPSYDRMLGTALECRRDRDSALEPMPLKQPIAFVTYERQLQQDATGLA